MPRKHDERPARLQRTDTPDDRQAEILVRARDEGGLRDVSWCGGDRGGWTTAVIARGLAPNTKPPWTAHAVLVRGMVRRDWLRQDGDEIEITALGEQALARAAKPAA